MSTTVTTSYGQLRGIDQGGSLAFKGIPFAAPPVGERRFAPPAPPHEWDGVRDAGQFGATSLQIPNESLNALLPDLIPEEPQAEDCLYLNVWTPALDGAKRPVLFWIHGGAFTMGSGSPPLYDGSHLAERGDVVVVTINYRLGALGFLCLADGVGEARTNFGLLDQIQALSWVRDEIRKSTTASPAGLGTSSVWRRRAAATGQGASSSASSIRSGAPPIASSTVST